jgi:hypothetical protein
MMPQSPGYRRVLNHFCGSSRIVSNDDIAPVRANPAPDPEG